jgi:adenylate kinase
MGHLFNGGAEKTQKEAGQLLDKGAKGAKELSRRVRDRIDTGTRDVVSVEESLVRHVRENPALYAFAAALLIGALIAKLILESRRTPQAPLL